MKKILAIIITIVITVCVGCSKTNTDITTQEGKDSKTSIAVSSNEPTPTGELNNEATPTPTPVSVLNANLKGEELIKSIKVQIPEKLLIEGESFSQDVTANTKTILYKDNIRTETEGPDGLSVMVYNSDDAVTYMYNDTEKKGTIYYDEEDSEDEDEMEADSESDYIAELEGLVNAEITLLDGVEVVYVESESSTGEGTYITKQWIDTRFWYPVKYETFFDGEMTSYYNTKKITDNFKIEDTMFSKPDDVEFMDLEGILGDMEGMISAE